GNSAHHHDHDALRGSGCGRRNCRSAARGSACASTAASARRARGRETALVVGKARAGTFALIVVSLPVLVGVFLYGPFVLDLFLHRRPPSRFLIPSGYVGWVRVDYRVATAPPLPREGKYLLVKVARDGSLQTST